MVGRERLWWLISACEVLLAESGINVSREAVCLWCIEFGALYARRCITTYAAIGDLFNFGRHSVRAQYHRHLRVNAFAEWGRAVA